MAFQAEDGSGRSDANSFGSVAQADAYHSVRPSAEDWGKLDTTAKERALVAATDWIVGSFADQWAGSVAFGGQALPWPRFGLIDPSTGMQYPEAHFPAALRDATFALAFQASKGELYNTASPLTPVLTEKTIGLITYKYANRGTADVLATRNFDFVGQMLSGLLQSRGFGLRVRRA